MLSIVVSGSNGFIGKHLISRIKKSKKYKLIVMSKSFGDISNEKTWKKLPKANVLIHLAAKSFVPDSWNNPKKFFETNVLGTLRALEYCRKYKSKLIFVSSYLYGNAEKLPTNEKAVIKIENPYSLTKKMAEDFCEFYSNQFGLKIVILRPSNVYGPGQKKKFLIPDIINKIKKKNIIIRNIKIKRDLIYIFDLVEAIIKSIFLKNKFYVLNIGSGKSYEIKKILKTFKKINDKNFIIRNKGIQEPNQILETKLNIKKANKTLKWKPIYSLEKGLKNTLYNINLSSK